MKRETKKQKQEREFYQNIAVYGKDEKGQEYITYHSIYGNIKDFSPWAIEKFKLYNNIPTGTKWIDYVEHRA